jgi:hypothetical protein
MFGEILGGGYMDSKCEEENVTVTTLMRRKRAVLSSIL